MFRLDQVTVRYGSIVALDDVSLEIGEGEQLCLIGPSGAGKSTLLGLLNGRVQPSSGTIHFAGANLNALSANRLRAARASIAWIPQSLGLVESLRVCQNVASGRVAQKGLHGLLRSYLLMPKAEKEAIYKLLESLGIEDKIFARTSQLSGGQQQRVAVARALYQEPRAILADEPVSAVDPERARALIALLKEVTADSGLTLIASLHDLALARESFPRIIGLRGGRVEIDGKAEDEALRALYEIKAER